MFGVVSSFRIDAPLNAQHDVHSDRSVINEQAVVAEVFEKSARAQWFEDVYLYNNYFYGVEKGIVVESGAFDGLTFSTTFAIQKPLNWTAVHIEGNNFDGYCPILLDFMCQGVPVTTINLSKTDQIA